MTREPNAATPSHARLSETRVLQAALHLADTQGLDALSMRRLGQELGVEAMSLYKHVANKDAILDGLIDRVAGEIAVPRPGRPWKAELRRRARSAHEVLMRHPWATMLMVSRANVGPAMLRYVDATIGCLREAGFSWAQADAAWNAIDNHVYGFTLQQLNFPFAPDEYAEKAEGYIPSLDQGAFPHLAGMTHEVIAGRHDGQHHLDFGLEMILDGLERLLEAPKAARKRR